MTLFNHFKLSDFLQKRIACVAKECEISWETFEINLRYKAQNDRLDEPVILSLIAKAYLKSFKRYRTITDFVFEIPGSKNRNHHF